MTRINRSKLYIQSLFSMGKQASRDACLQGDLRSDVLAL